MIDQWIQNLMSWIWLVESNDVGALYTNQCRAHWKEMGAPTASAIFVRHLVYPEMSSHLGGLYGSEVGQLRLIVDAEVNDGRYGQAGQDDSEDYQ